MDKGQPLTITKARPFERLGPVWRGNLEARMATEVPATNRNETGWAGHELTRSLFGGIVARHFDQGLRCHLTLTIRPATCLMIAALFSVMYLAHDSARAGDRLRSCLADMGARG